MVGDSESDMLFGRSAGMRIVFLADEEIGVEIDERVDSLLEFAAKLR